MAQPAGAATSGDGERLLAPNGVPLFVTGINYEGPADRAWQMWDNDKFDAGAIDADVTATCLCQLFDHLPFDSHHVAQKFICARIHRARRRAVVALLNPIRPDQGHFDRASGQALSKPIVVQQRVVQQFERLGDALAIKQDRILPLMSGRLIASTAFEKFMISLYPRLPLLDPGNHSKTFHETCPAKLAVDDDRQVVRNLFGNDIANRVILSLSQLGFARVSFAIVGKRVFDRVGP